MCVLIIIVSKGGAREGEAADWLLKLFTSLGGVVHLNGHGLQGLPHACCAKAQRNVLRDASRYYRPHGDTSGRSIW